MTIPNLPPADDLADVRARIKALKEREDALKQLMISDPSARTGNRYLVEVTDRVTHQLDTTELKADARAKQLIEEHTHPVTRTYVEIPYEFDQDTGEITRIKRSGK